MASQTASAVRSAALRKRCLSLAKSCSMRLRSGEYFGRKNSLAPADRMARRTALPRCEPRLSRMTMSPGLRVGRRNLLYIEPEPLAIDRPVDEPGGVDAIVAERREEGHGLPAAVRDLGVEPAAARRPTPERRHVGLRPGLVDEDEAAAGDPVLVPRPLRTPARDIGTIPLAGD